MTYLEARRRYLRALEEHAKPLPEAQGRKPRHAPCGKRHLPWETCLASRERLTGVTLVRQ